MRSRELKAAASSIVLGIFLLLLTLSQAEAKPQDWVSADYSFQTIQKLYIEDMDVQALENSEFINKDITARNIQQFLHQRAAEKVQAARIVTSELIMDASVKSSVEQYAVTSRIIPAHSETRYRTEELTYTENGKKKTVRYNVPYQVFIPEETVYTSTVRLRFDVMDAATGETVFSRDDTRVDDYSRNPESTYKKLVTAFYNELNRKIKNAK